MDIGHTSAAELWQAAVAGQFRLEPDTARECAAHFDWFAEMMRLRQEEMGRLQKLDGFGGFDSAQQLQSGFEGKAVQGAEALIAAEQSALRMKAAILRAAGMLDEADAANAAAISTATREVTQ
ncbi:hypothetical protein ACWEPH_00970 [Nocardia beijingensis]|uniref:hypothetical protein n=1 Tax=Nocardia sp. NPDC051787 TaxID=3155415 RepID=UPI0034483076